MTAKNALIANTPRKLPFQDTTNQSDAFKTPAKGLKSEPSQFKKIQLKEEARKLSYEEEDDDGDWFEQFAHPADKNCRCCGKDQVSDLEQRTYHVDIERILKEQSDLDYHEDTAIPFSWSPDSSLIYEMEHEPTIYTPPGMKASSPFKYCEPKIPSPWDEYETEEEIGEADSGILHDNSSSSVEQSAPLVIPPLSYFDISDDEDFHGHSMASLDTSIINQW